VNQANHNCPDFDMEYVEEKRIFVILLLLLLLLLLLIRIEVLINDILYKYFLKDFDGFASNSGMAFTFAFHLLCT